MQNTLSQDMFPPLSFQTIIEPSKILELEELDIFMDNWNKNPFLLSEFISQSLTAKGWKPLFLVIKADGKIVGTAPLMIREQMGMRFVVLSPRTYAPDFIVDSRYKDTVMDSIFNFLFEKLNCRWARFWLSEESPNLKTIKNQCKNHEISFSSENQNRLHYVIPVECTWDEFQKKRGRRRIIRQIERKLDEIGPWSVEYIEDVSQGREVLEKVLEIEKKSWKAQQEPEVIAGTTEELLTTWAASENVPRTKTDFKCSVWFLKIKNETVAYTFVIKYKETAFILKTSYDDRYKKSYVGKYINNIAIRDMFNGDLIENIDFMSNFPFMSFWDPLSSNIVEVTMWKGNIVALWRFLRLSTIASKFLKTYIKLPTELRNLLKNLSAIFN